MSRFSFDEFKDKVSVINDIEELRRVTLKLLEIATLHQEAIDAQMDMIKLLSNGKVNLSKHWRD